MITRIAPVIGSIPCIAEIDISTISPDDLSSKKGSRTWNFPVPNGANNLAVFLRKPSDQVGGHFHPRCPNKDPEIFVLLKGVMEFKFQDLYGEVSQHVLDARMNPVRLLLPPYIFHEVRVVEEALYIELQYEPFIPEVNYSYDEFMLLRTII